MATFRTITTNDRNSGIGLRGSAVKSFRAFQGRIVLGARTYAALTTALTGTNNDLTYTAVTRGLTGNDVRVRYVVAGANTALSVAVSGNDITVNVATDGSSAATSTAAQVRTAVLASAPAAALVGVANATGNDGTGVVTALAYTALAGGLDYKRGG